MSQYTINLLSGKPQRIEQRGVFFMVRSVTNDATLDVTIEVRGEGDRNDEVFLAVEGGFKAKIAHSKFEAIRIKASADCTVVYVASDNDVDFDFFAGAQVNATLIAPLPLPVMNDRGSPGSPVFISGVLPGTSPAATIVEQVQQLIDDTPPNVVLAADVNRVRIIVTNLDATNDVAVGGAGLTWAKRANVLSPGDTWIEDRAANLAMHAVCDAGKTATIGIQVVTA